LRLVFPVEWSGKLEWKGRDVIWGATYDDVGDEDEENVGARWMAGTGLRLALGGEEEEQLPE
jgi:hypothetical protein